MLDEQVMHQIHDVFPEDNDNSHDPISEKKLIKKEGHMSTRKTLLGFDFNGEDKHYGSRRANGIKS
jgi:hypothetical protein